MPRSRWIVLGLIAANGCAFSSEDSSRSALVAGKEPAESWRPYAASEPVAGKSLSDWATEYMRYILSWTDCQVPLLDPDGSTCNAFQRPDSPVFFLQQGEPGTERNKCSVPADKPLLVPLIAFATDNAGVPPERTRSEQALREDAEKVRDTFTDLRLVVDEKEIAAADLEAYAVEPTRYSYELGPEPNVLTCYGMPGFSGPVDPSFVTGYFVLMAPPPPGEHRLEYAGVGYAYYEELGREVATANHVHMAFTIDKK